MKLTRWDTKEVIFELECSSWEELLKGALKANISFYRSDFRESDFRDSDFRDSDFRDSDFRESDFSRSDFRGSDFRYSNFSGLDSSDSNFRYSSFNGSDFRGSNFRYSKFIRSNFRRSDFRYSNFSGSDSRDSDFRYSNFSGSLHQNKIGNMIEWKSMQLDTYMIVFNKKILCIGCQQHEILKWKEFTDDEIKKMDDNALEWWVKWREFIFKAIELSGENK